MTNVPKAGPGETPQGGLNNTPALNAFVQKVEGSRLLRLKAVNTNANAFREALRSDLERNYAGRGDGQIDWLEQAALDSLRMKKPGGLEEVRAVQQRLNTLSGRVRILCDAASRGLDELLKREGGGVLKDDVVDQIQAGLNLGLPDSENKMEIQTEILGKAEDKGFPGTKQYLEAARKALRREIQAPLVTDAIMEQFQGLGSEEKVVSVVLKSLHARRRDAGKTQVEKPRKAGAMSGDAIRDLEQALNDREFQSEVRNAVRPGRNERAVTGAGVVPQPNEGVLAELRNELNRRA